ncbi:MAG: peptide chain release factor N(5)-glutamine methyltransferase [Candidatus Omnitrophota bacterium]
MDYSETIPIQYQEGKTTFMGMDICVVPGVFIPRPETELLVRIVTELCEEKLLDDAFVLDLGTGSGIIPLGIKMLMKKSRIIGADISEDALTVARRNLRRLSVQDNVHFIKSDMFSFFGSEYEETFDAIVSNPPYVSEKDYEKLDAWVLAEPKIALCSGAEGMDGLHIIIRESNRFLKPGGFVAVEIGYDQAEKVKKVFKVHGFIDIKGYRDFNGYERVITGHKHG